MNLTQVFKSALALLFACTVSFSMIGCEPPAETPSATPAAAPEGGEEAPAEGGSGAPAGEAVPE